MLQILNLPESAVFTTGVDSKSRSANLTRAASTVAATLDTHTFDDINRLLTAAAINRKFCQLLLTNPAAAIAVGYHNEKFTLSATEIAVISSIRATTLPEFSRALYEFMQINEV